MKTWGDIFYKHKKLSADPAYAAFMADEYERRKLKETVEEMLYKTTARLFLGHETACTTTRESPPLTIDALEEIAAKIKRVPRIVIMQNEFCTVTKTHWIGGQKIWRDRPLSLRRAALALMAGLLAIGASSWLMLTVAVLVILARLRGWYITEHRHCIHERVPDPALYKIDAGNSLSCFSGGEILIVGHPVTVANMKQQAAAEGVDLERLCR